MGMYTELVVKCNLQDNLPEEVENVLQYLFNRKTNIPKEVPKHPFFSCPRWTMIGSCSSYYHVPFALSKYEEGYIFSRSDLKEYDNEIEYFFDWIRPYIETYGTKICIGWSWYEEDDKPTLIFS